MASGAFSFVSPVVAEIPSSKSQTSFKEPGSKKRGAAENSFEPWFLGFVWSLGFGNL
jgi:hypothetical protein